MADTQRTRAAMISLFADNVTGQVSAQDARDFIVTIMNEEFANAVDFWTEPLPEYITTDKTGRGFIEYSQTAGEDISALAAIYKDSNGLWKMGLVSDATERPELALAVNTGYHGESRAHERRGHKDVEEHDKELKHEDGAV